MDSLRHYKVGFDSAAWFYRNIEPKMQLCRQKHRAFLTSQSATGPVQKTLPVFRFAAAPVQKALPVSRFAVAPAHRILLCHHLLRQFWDRRPQKKLSRPLSQTAHQKTGATPPRLKLAYPWNWLDCCAFLYPAANQPTYPASLYPQDIPQSHFYIVDILPYSISLCNVAPWPTFDPE